MSEQAYRIKESGEKFGGFMGYVVEGPGIVNSGDDMEHGLAKRQAEYMNIAHAAALSHARQQHAEVVGKARDAIESALSFVSCASGSEDWCGCEDCRVEWEGHQKTLRSVLALLQPASDGRATGKEDLQVGGDALTDAATVDAEAMGTLRKCVQSLGEVMYAWRALSMQYPITRDPVAIQARANAAMRSAKESFGLVPDFSPNATDAIIAMCPVCGSKNDADKERNCGTPSPRQAVAE